MSYCPCPVLFRTSRKKKDGTIEYAKTYGLKCFVIPMHKEDCELFKVKAAV
jgi:hypothetical protein